MEKEDRKKLVQIIYKKRYLIMNILHQEADISCPKHCVESVCLYSELFSSVFSRIRTEHRDTPYLSAVFSPNAEKHWPE